MFKLMAAVVLAVPMTATAAIYRWVDTEGHVHYTDKAEANAEPINVHTGQPREVEPIPAATSSDPSIAGDQAAQKKGDCDQKKKQYESYRTAAKIVETDSLGRAHEYTPDEQKQLVQRSQQAMKDACGTSVTSSATP
jgi:hypothetical protein